MQRTWGQQLLHLLCHRRCRPRCRLKCDWDPRAKVWRFPIADQDRVLEALARVRGVRVSVEPLHHVPHAVIQVRCLGELGRGRLFVQG